MKNFNKMLLLLITLLFLLTLQGVSAIDNDNLTQELQSGDNDNSFSALQSLIDGGNATINLDKDYVQYDGEKTIKISRNVEVLPILIAAPFCSFTAERYPKYSH